MIVVVVVAVAVVMALVSLVACNFFGAICWIALKYVLLAASYLRILQMGRGSVAPVTFQILRLSTAKGGTQCSGRGEGWATPTLNSCFDNHIKTITLIFFMLPQKKRISCISSSTADKSKGKRGRWEREQWRELWRESNKERAVPQLFSVLLQSNDSSFHFYFQPEFQLANFSFHF